MSKIKRQVQKRNLSNIQTWITDTSPTSEYFQITQLPEVIPGGKSGFLINGTDVLVKSTDVLVELVDVNGNTIFLQPIRNYQEGLSRVVSIEIYDDTPIGPARLTVLGEAVGDIAGNRVPDEWIGRYNVKWETTVLVDRNRVNTTTIRLFERPELVVSESLIPYRESVPSTTTNISTGSLTGQYFNGGVEIVGTSEFNEQRQFVPAYTSITSEQPIFTRDSVNGRISGVINPGITFTASVTKVINDTTVRVSPIVNSSNIPVTRFTTNAFTHSFTPSTTFITSSFNRSFANIHLKKLTTFTGDIQRAKFFVKGIDADERYELLDDITLESTQLTTTRSIDGELISLGRVRDQAFINEFWSFGQIQNNTTYVQSSPSPTLDLLYNTSRLIDSTVLSGSLATTVAQTTSRTPRLWMGINRPFELQTESEYKFNADILCIKPRNTVARMEVYVDGGLFSAGRGSELGLKIAEFVVGAGDDRKNFINYTNNFLSLYTDVARLRFVIYSGQWFVSNAELLSIRETGFNPDEIQIFAPVVGRRFEPLKFKAELYDANSNLVPLTIETDYIDFDGGNVYIRGGDNRIAGTLTVAPSGSGPSLSSEGFLNTSGNFVNGQSIYIGPTPPTVAGLDTAFFVGTSSAGPEISIADKLYGYRTGTDFNLELDGTVLIKSGSNRFDIKTLFPAIQTRVIVTGQDTNNIFVSASAIDPLGIQSTSLTFNVEPPGAVTVTQMMDTFTIAKPVGNTVARVTFIGSAPSRIPGEDFIMVSPAGAFTGSVTIPPFLSLVMVPSIFDSGSITFSASVNEGSGTVAIPVVTIDSSFNIGGSPTTLAPGIFRVPRPVSGTGQVVFKNNLSGYISDYDPVNIPNISDTTLPFLSTRLTLVSQTTSSITVSASVVDPLNQFTVGNGITLIPAIEPISSTTFTGTNPYVIQRPLGIDSKFLVTAAAANRISDSDFIPIIGIQTNDRFLNLVMTDVAETTTTLTVSTSVNSAPNSALVPNVIVQSSNNVGTITNISPGVFNITKPVSGTGQVLFKNSLAGFIDDFDGVIVNNISQTILPRITVRSTVLSETDTTLTVTSSFVDSLGIINTSNGGILTPTIEPAGATTFIGSNPWIITKPNNGSAVFIVNGTAPNRQSDFDKTTILPIQRDLTFLSLLMLPISETQQTVRVSSSINEASGSPSTPFITVYTSSNIPSPGPIQVSPGIWDIPKPLTGSGVATFKNSLSGFIDDFDTVIVGNVSDVLQPRLTILATITSQSATTITVSCSVNDPLNLTTGSITTQVQPIGSVTVSGINPFTVSRPINASGSRVNFIVTAPNRISDIDPVNIPPQAVATLSVRATLVQTNADTAVYNVVVTDPIPESPINLNINVNNVSSILPAGNITVSSSEVRIVTVGRPEHGTGTGRATFIATSPRRTEGTDAVEVPERSIENSSTNNTIIVTGSATVTSTTITIPATIPSSSTARRVEFWVTEELVAPGATASVARSSYERGTLLSSYFRNSNGTENFNTSIPVTRPGTWVTVWAVPIDILERNGVVTNRLYVIPSAPPTPPNAFAAVNSVSVGETTATNSVTLPSTNLPTSIAVYINGVFNRFVGVTVGANQTQNITDTGLIPDTTYTFQYAPVNASAEGTRSVPITVRTTAPITTQLPPPEVSFLGSDASNVIRFSFVNNLSYPLQTVFTGEYQIGTGPWIALSPESDTILFAGPFSIGTTGNARFRVSNPNFATSNFTDNITWFVVNAT